MSDTKIYATIENGRDSLIISGSLRLLREYQPDPERAALALDAVYALLRDIGRSARPATDATHEETLQHEGLIASSPPSTGMAATGEPAHA